MSSEQRKPDSIFPGFSGVSPELTPLLISRRVSRLSIVTASSVRMAMLSGVAGFADAAGFVVLSGLFPAHVTGEIVAAVAAVSGQDLAKELPRLAVVLVFVLAVVLGALVTRIFRERGRSPLAALLWAMAFALLLFAISDRLFPHGGTAHFAWKAGTVVGAMGLQNVIMRRALTSSCPTTVMTGNLTQFMIELVELSLSRFTLSGSEGSALRARSEARLRAVGLALGVFCFSAIWGGALTFAFGSASALVPALVLGVLAWKERRHPMPLNRTGTLY